MFPDLDSDVNSLKSRVLCLTFDNLGEARNVFLKKSAVPDWEAPEITIGFPQILQLLDRLKIRATFFVEGWSALHYKAIIENIHNGGHEIGLHGWIHERFASLDQRAARQFIHDGLRVLQLRGIQPFGFRAPGGQVGAYTRQILADYGFIYDSSVETALPKCIPNDVSGFIGDKIQQQENGLVCISWQWFMVDAVHYSLADNGLRDPQLLSDYWSQLIRNIAQANGFVTLICHAHVTGTDSNRMVALEKVLRLALALGYEIVPAIDLCTRVRGLSLDA
ncbi:polysaccharide deacetylase family protein [Microbulbifer variabilis]|uniref:polysaccharide deacetylase family protein n=1 Tax=Microbulbifer variabilis TaxID=266805 RepID=UPI001CFCDEB9|nr:polysaccharide deacetylase family protein [Microbulbifer variabilis]